MMLPRTRYAMRADIQRRACNLQKARRDAPTAMLVFDDASYLKSCRVDDMRAALRRARFRARDAGRDVYDIFSPIERSAAPYAA